MPGKLPTPTSKRRPKKAKRYRFGPTDRFRYGNCFYIYLREIEGGHAFRVHPDGIEQCATHDEMQAIVEDRDFKLDRGYFGPAAAAARSLGLATSLAELPAAEQGEIVRKVFYCRRFIELEAEARLPGAGQKVTRSDSSMKAAIERIKGEISTCNGRAEDDYPQRKNVAGKVPAVAGGRAPSPRTLRKWLGAYEVAGGYPIALRDRRVVSGNRLPRLHPDVQRLIHTQCARYQTEKRPSIKNCHDELTTAVRAENAKRKADGLKELPIPSIAALRRAIDQLPKFRTHARRHGVDAAKKRFRLVTRTLEVLRPGERIEMDEWTIQLQTIVAGSPLWAKMTNEERRLTRGRWLVCVAIDVATKALVAACLNSTATASLAKRTLEMVTIDKSALAPGAITLWDMALSPDNVFTDGGAAFTCAEFVGSVADLGARHDVPPGGMPHLRGSIERSFRSIEEGFLPNFTGRTFSGVDEKGDYDARRRASMSPEALARALAIYVADVYNNTPHDGLGGETPRNAWTRLTGEFGVYPPPGPHDRRAIFGTEVERCLSLRGVRFLGLHYSDEGLGEHILEHGLHKVRIRVDEHDIGYVSLETPDGWRPLRSRTAGFDGVTARDWLAALAEVKSVNAKADAVTRGTVLNALGRIRAIAAEAEASAGIILQVLGTEALEAEEAKILVNFDVNLDDDGDGGEYPLEVIPTGPGGGTPPSARDGGAALPPTTSSYGMEDE